VRQFPINIARCRSRTCAPTWATAFAPISRAHHSRTIPLPWPSRSRGWCSGTQSPKIWRDEELLPRDKDARRSERSHPRAWLLATSRPGARGA
jgi:hypothetical protein